MIAVGAVAPDFELKNQNWDSVRLSDFRGNANVVIAFHPLAFTPVCAAQVQTYERERPRLEALGAHVLAVSVDAAPSKKAWAAELGGVSYDLLSDFHPRGHVAAAYGVLRDDGISERAIFVVDKAGIVRWTRLHAIPEHPDFEEVAGVLARLAAS